MSYSTSGGAHPAEEYAREPAAAGEVRPAEQIQGSHDTYDKGEVSSIGALVGDITTNLSTLMSQEVALAKAELRQSAQKAGKGAGLLGGAGVAGHFVLLFLSLALFWLIADWTNLIVSAVIVAVLWAIVAAVLAARGRAELKKVEGMPRTVETAKHVPDALKGNEDNA